MGHERRPTGPYYETRGPLFSQGDIFRDVPLAYPSPAAEILVDADDPGGGARAFVSGPLSFGLAMLITPTCSMRAQRSAGYAHPVRTLVPILSVAQLELAGVVDLSRRGLADKRDALINYMWIPGDADRGIPEDALALLYMPVTLHHGLLEGNRVTQLTVSAAQQLQKKLVWHSSSVLLARDDFVPPMD